MLSKIQLPCSLNMDTLYEDDVETIQEPAPEARYPHLKVQSEFFLRAPAYLQSLGLVVLKPVYWLNSLFAKSESYCTVPPVENNTLLFSAKVLAEKIRRKEVSCESVVELYIQRLSSIDPVINSLVENRFDAARLEAKAVDDLLKSTSKTEEELEKQFPLLGVPLTVKESCKLKGLSHTGCSLTRYGKKADENGVAVDLLISAGAIPVAVTSTPELCLNWETYNMMNGRTLNPYNLGRTCGGSSGGEGATIACCGSVIGIGSDIAGSIRIPASFNGIFGHKPSKFLVSIDGHYPSTPEKAFKETLTLGPMSRYACDLRLMMKVLTSKSSPQIDFDQKVDFKDVKFFVMEELGLNHEALSVDHQIRSCIKNAAGYFEKEKGSTVKYDCKFPFTSKSVEICCGIFSQIQQLPNILQKDDSSQECDSLVLELLKSIVGFSKYAPSTLLVYLLLKLNLLIVNLQAKRPKLIEARDILLKELEETLGRNGVLILPTFPKEAFYHSSYILQTDGSPYTMLFNVLGLPATHVPTGLNRNGMPIGLQVVASTNQDHLCLSVAEELENVFGGWIPPCKIDI